MRLCTHERERRDGKRDGDGQGEGRREGGGKPGKIMSLKVLCQHTLLLVQIPEVSSRF